MFNGGLPPLGAYPPSQDLGALLGKRGSVPFAKQKCKKAQKIPEKIFFQKSDLLDKMNQKIKIGDKITWGGSKTVYTITDIDFSSPLNSQILFEWQEEGSIRSIWCYSYHDIIDLLNRSLIYMVNPMEPIKYLKKISL